MVFTSIEQIEAAIFDYGAVLCHPPSEAEISEFAAMTGLSPAEFWKIYGDERSAYDRGAISPNEYWGNVSRAAGVQFTSEQIATFVGKDRRIWSRINEEMVEFAGSLRAAGMKTAILSNMHQDFLQALRADAKWLDQFDVKVFSCEVRLVKPEDAIYKLVLERLQVEPARALFIDDIARNVEAAERAGINAFLFRSLAELRSLFACRLAPPNSDGRID